jgi:hypothetical protein
MAGFIYLAVLVIDRLLPSMPYKGYPLEVYSGKPPRKVKIFISTSTIYYSLKHSILKMV